MMSLNLKQRIMFGAVALAVATGFGCAVGAVPESLDPIFDDFAHQPLVMNPVVATEAGYHEHTGADGSTVQLDEMWGDYSAAGIQARVAYYGSVRSQLNNKDVIPEREKLRSVRWSSYGATEDRIERSLFELQTRQQYETDPLFYTDLIGRGLLVPVVEEYASESERAGHVTARLEKLPELLQQAQGNLTSSSQLQIGEARSQVAGLITMIESDIPSELPSATGAEYSAAADDAVAAMNGFSTFLEGLSTSGDWRMGSNLFEEKLKVDSSRDDISLNSVLEELQADYDEVYDQLIEVARPIHRGIYGSQRPPTDYAMMRDILDIVSDDNRLRSEDGMVARIEENIEKGKAFMQEEELMAFPQGVELTVSQTPTFLRTRYPVSAFFGAPVLHPDNGAHFWLSPLPAGASRGAQLAKLREFNNFKLQIVAINAFGSYLQSAISATGDPELDEVSKLIRNVNGNRAIKDGWSHYTVDSTMEYGYEERNANFQLNWLKYKLEFLANAMLDIQLHTQGLSEQDARTMLQRQVFMESGAVASAVRTIQLNPTSSAIAYIGSGEWVRVRQEYQTQTNDFSLGSFHTKALSAGPVPAEELLYLTTLE